ncbi:MAG TPA: RDD family protein [Terriglobia bacterium]|nr:RDD family protein [Terriglobia bacterium]
METDPSSLAVAKCAECGSFFAPDDMIRHGNVFVCANCKPRFMQKLAEGAEIHTGEMRYAGFWLRLAGVLLDGIILLVANSALQLIVVYALSQSFFTTPDSSAVILFLVLYLIQLAISISYETILIGKYGATVGKMACKIKVITADGGRVSYLRAVARYFAKFLSGIILLIGYIMAAFDPEKRAMHDRICNTRVVYK